MSLELDQVVENQRGVQRKVRRVVPPSFFSFADFFCCATRSRPTASPTGCPSRAPCHATPARRAARTSSLACASPRRRPTQRDETRTGPACSRARWWGVRSERGVCRGVRVSHIERSWRPPSAACSGRDSKSSNRSRHRWAHRAPPPATRQRRDNNNNSKDGYAGPTVWRGG